MANLPDSEQKHVLFSFPTSLHDIVNIKDKSAVLREYYQHNPLYVVALFVYTLLLYIPRSSGIYL